MCIVESPQEFDTLSLSSKGPVISENDNYNVQASTNH